MPSLVWSALTKADVSHGASVATVSIPEIDDTEVLVKVKTVAQNVCALIVSQKLREYRY